MARSPWSRICSTAPAPGRTPSFSISQPMWTRGNGPKSRSCSKCWSETRQRNERGKEMNRVAKVIFHMLVTSLFLCFVVPRLHAQAQPQTQTPAASQAQQADKDKAKEADK